MIISIEVSLQRLSQLERKFDWPRPDCPRCGGTIWGHGFVGRFFNRFRKAIPVKRWRCRECHLVICYRPREYWQRYQEKISVIWDVLLFRVRHGKWPPDVTRQRGGHWLAKLTKKVKLETEVKSTLEEAINFYRAKKLTIF